MAIEVTVNGEVVSLPDIPADVLAEYPYATIIHSVKTDEYDSYILVMNAGPVYFTGPDDTVYANGLLPLVNGSSMYSAENGDASWTLEAESETGAFPLKLGTLSTGSLSTLVWANHDVCYGTRDSGTLIATDEVYFANSTPPITLNGLTFPGLPAGLFDAYPYAALNGIYLSDYGWIYVLIAADVPSIALPMKLFDDTASDDEYQCVFTTGELDDSGIAVKANYRTFAYNFPGAPPGEWLEEDMFEGPLYIISSSYGYLLSWVNHDVKLATATVDAEGNTSDITILDELLYDIDKEYRVKWPWLVSIGNCARKLGATTAVTPDEMVSSLANATPAVEITLQNKTATENGTYTADSGYDGLGTVTVNIPLQDKAITENGTYTADDGYGGLGTITVGVANLDDETALDDFIQRAIPVGDYENDRVTKVGAGVFSRSTITAASFPNVTEIGEGAFSYCESLETADFPNVLTIGKEAFERCENLGSVNFPLATTIEAYAFTSCYHAPTTMKFPSAVTIGTGAFGHSWTTVTIDLPVATNIGSYAFTGSSRLTALILRSNTQAVAKHSNILDGCEHFYGTVDATYNPNGDKDGYIYVPSALVDTYKADSVWSTFADRFRALEDYTVDGTTTGELDSTKI